MVRPAQPLFRLGSGIAGRYASPAIEPSRKRLSTSAETGLRKLTRAPSDCLPPQLYSASGLSGWHAGPGPRHGACLLLLADRCQAEDPQARVLTLRADSDCRFSFPDFTTKSFNQLESAAPD